MALCLSDAHSHQEQRLVLVLGVRQSWSCDCSWYTLVLHGPRVLRYPSTSHPHCQDSAAIDPWQKKFRVLVMGYNTWRRQHPLSAFVVLLLLSKQCCSQVTETVPKEPSELKDNVCSGGRTCRDCMAIDPTCGWCAQQVSGFSTFDFHLHLVS